MTLSKKLLDAGCREEIKGRGIVCYTLREFVIAKKCTSCGEVQRIENFHKSDRGVGFRRSQCRDCKNNSTKEWRKQNVNKISEYLDANKEKRKESSAAWRINNIEYVRKEKLKWARNNKEKRMLSEQRRVAAKAQLVGDCTPRQFNKTLAHFGNGCVLTRKDANLHSDHVIPLAIGHGGTTYGNMIPLDATLNISKNDRHLFEWFEENAERLGLQRNKFDALIAYLANANEMTTAEYRAYVDWCFDNPRIIDDATGKLVFRDGPINERNKTESRR